MIIKNQSPIHKTSDTDLEAQLIAHDALLICTNLRATHIKNKWGDLTLSALNGYVTQNHEVHATCVNVKLEQSSKPATIVTAQEASLIPNTHMLTLTGSVEAFRADDHIKTDTLTLNMRKHTVVATGNVVIQSTQGKISTDQAILEQQKNRLDLAGHVQTEFSLRKRQYEKQY